MKQIKKKPILMLTVVGGFVLTGCALISISFNYLLHNGSKDFVFNVNKFFNVLISFIYGFVIAYLLWPIVNLVFIHHQLGDLKVLLWSY